MTDLLSPKQVAASIGVSESSLKRWCDQGLLTVERTAGGHRKIRQCNALRFLRERQHTVVKPEALGLPPGLGKTPRSYEQARDHFDAALRRGDQETARRVILELYIAGMSVAQIGDEVIGPAVQGIGHSWERGDIEIFEEHRSTEIVNRVLYELRSLLPPPPEDARVALGGTPAGDPSRLPTLMVEMVLAEQGWNAISLGSSLPFDTLLAAIRQRKPDLVWLSCSHLEADDTWRVAFYEFVEQLPEACRLVVGGRQIAKCDDRPPARAEVCTKLADLQSLLVQAEE